MAVITPRNKQCFVFVLGLMTLTMIWSIMALGPDRQVTTNKVIPYAKAVHSHVSPQQTILTANLTHLEKHVKTDEFSYTQRTIRTKYFSGERPTTTTINETLFETPQTLSKDDLDEISLQNHEVLELPVPRSPVVDTSIMSFSIATKVDRLERAVQFFHWLPKTGAQLHVISPLPWDRASTVERDFKARGINVTIMPSDLPFAKAYFYGIKELYESRTPDTKWIVLMDDDTFIPSLPYLVNHLNKNYDASKEVMVAATSDSIDQVKIFGLIPFGGGGIFLSVPLAASLVKDDVWTKCMDTQRDQGDGLMNECLNNYSPIRPTFDLGLNQMDFRGDAGGYFESGRRMLTVHHWKTWFDVDIPMAGNVSKACGFECVFQRFRFDGNVVLSNGYSVVEYPDGIEDKEGKTLIDLDQVELTWTGAKENYEHHIGPLRSPLGREKKRTLRLVEVVVLEGVGVRQTYLERFEEPKVEEGKNVKRKSEEMRDRVVELLWLM